MSNSIRARLLAGTSAAMLVTLGAAGAVVYLRTRDTLHEQFDATLATKARALALLVEFDDEDGLDSDLSPQAAPGDYFELWGPDGASIVRASSLGGQHLARLPGQPALVYADARLADGTQIRQAQLVFAPRQEREEQEVHAEAPVVTLAIATSTAAVDASVARIGTILLVVGGAALLAALALLAWLIRVGLRPVHGVASAIAAIDADNLGVARRDVAVPTELRPITERLDDLLRRLDAAFARERELTAEVAHELRTPLSGLRSTIEVSLGKDRSPERYRETLAECLAIGAQAERTVEMLLALARLDASMVVPNAEPAVIDDIARESIARFTARATERGLALDSDLAAATARVDRDQLRVVIDNLLDNAVTHADANGVIRVAVAGREIRVASTCTTLAPDQAARVFDRFWRADRARTSGRNAGLGLALCKKLIALAGGTIDATVADGMFVVTVRLPAA